MDAMDYARVFCHNVEIFSLPSRGQGRIGRLLKFAGYIHNHKILPGNIFGFILKNKMAVFFNFRQGVLLVI